MSALSAFIVGIGTGALLIAIVEYPFRPRKRTVVHRTVHIPATKAEIDAALRHAMLTAYREWRP